MDSTITGNPILVCETWGERPAGKNCLRKNCKVCQASLALFQENIGKVSEEHMELVCVQCALALLKSPDTPIAHLNLRTDSTTVN